MRHFAASFAFTMVILPFCPLQAQTKVDLIELNPQPTLTGACHPTRAHFSGKIRTNGPLDVTYEWLRSDGARTEHTLHFGKAQTQSISTDWSISKSYSGWMQLVILSPKRLQTSKANFQINCGH